MNLRLVQFSLGPDSRAGAEAIADELVPAIRERPGCQSCTFFADYETGDYGLVVLWESRDDARDAAAIIGPKLTAALAGAEGTADSRRLFDVYVRPELGNAAPGRRKQRALRRTCVPWGAGRI